MNLAIKIAWRNLCRHKGKSLVIGVILFIGAVLMTVGNGIIAGMDKGFSDNIIHLFTGDLLVISSEQDNDDVLFDFSGKPLKVIKNYQAVKKILGNKNLVTDYLPANAGYVMVFNSGFDIGSTMLLGVDITHYRKFFPGSFIVTEGKVFRTGERGLLVSEEGRQQMYDSMNFWLVPEGGKLQHAALPLEVQANPDGLEIRNDLVFMGASESNTTVDVRVPVKAIFKYKSFNKIWGSYGIVDIESFREAHNYVTGANHSYNISQEKKILLETDQLDSLFSTGSLVDNTIVTSKSISADTIQETAQEKSNPSTIDLGSYNLIFLKIPSHTSPRDTIHKLNALFKKNHLQIRVVSWKDAIGTVGNMAAMLKASLDVFIMFIFFVAIIVIMNTLSMAALERTSELAMMRAIGTRISFLQKMFVYETGMLSFCFGGLGIICGFIIIFILKSAHITTTNEMLQLVYGGDILNPLFTLGDLVLEITELVLVTFLAVLYPLRVVEKIVPLDAIARE